ncbi:MAG: hypothetical protein AAF749_12375, partial [Pseudomonadota bacterium]
SETSDTDRINNRREDGAVSDKSVDNLTAPANSEPALSPSSPSPFEIGEDESNLSTAGSGRSVRVGGVTTSDVASNVTNYVANVTKSGAGDSDAANSAANNAANNALASRIAAAKLALRRNEVIDLREQNSQLRQRVAELRLSLAAFDKSANEALVESFSSKES